MAVWSKIRLSELRGTFRLDAEFWQPEHIETEQRLLQQPHERLGELVTTVRKGVFNILADSYVEEGVAFYRSANVGQVFPKESGLVFITEDRHAAESKTALRRGDLMLAKTGKEAASVVLRDHCNVSQDVVAIRPNRKRINPFYLAVYLNTRPGVLQMRRWFQGQVQFHLSLPDARQIVVPTPPSSFQKQIEGKVYEAESLQSAAESALATGETLLVEALGLSGLDFSETLNYSRKFADLQAANRFGAEYFMPCKQRALDGLAAKPGKPISAHCESVREMFDPTDATRDERIRNFDVTDALEPVLDDCMSPMAAVEIGSMKKRFQAGDLVVSRLRSYLREIALVRTSPNLPAVGSSEFIVLRPRTTGKGSLTPETLLIFLRSLPVQTILKWSQDGSQHPRFNESDLLAIRLPAAVLAVAPSIDALVHEALKARAEAGRLLEKATAEVEQRGGPIG